MMDHPHNVTRIGESRSVQQGAVALAHLLNDERYTSQLHAVEQAIDGLHTFVYEIDGIADEDASLNDEMLNWCFVECISNLRAAVWNTAGGCYPTAFTATRRALALGVACLEFTLMDRDAEAGVAREATGGRDFIDFAAWEAGEALPTIEATMARLAARTEFIRFSASSEMDVGAHAVLLDTQLTEPSRHHHMQLGFEPGLFHEGGFAAAVEVLHEVVGTVAACWLVALPQLASSTRASVGGEARIEAVFVHPWPRRVLDAVAEMS